MTIKGAARLCVDFLYIFRYSLQSCFYFHRTIITYVTDRLTSWLAQLLGNRLVDFLVTDGPLLMSGLTDGFAGQHSLVCWLRDSLVG